MVVPHDFFSFETDSSISCYYTYIVVGMKANIISAASINHAIAICELTKVVSRSN